MAKLHMEIWEIVQDYQRAKNKGDMLRVLADRNCCDVKDIIELLRAEGEEVKLPTAKKNKKKKAESAPPSPDREIIIEAIKYYKKLISDELADVERAKAALTDKISRLDSQILLFENIKEGLKL